MRLLYIGEKQITKRHGWDQVNYRNQFLCEQLFDQVVYLPIGYKSFQEKLFVGITSRFLKKVDLALEKSQIDYVFVCQSTCGRVCKHIKNKYPNIKIITFFHNIEKQYASQYFKVSGLKSIPFYLRASIFEKLAAKHSDYCITLNNRDSKLLEGIYGRRADAVMPTSLEDIYQEKDSIISNGDQIIDLLFVGTAFYPNIEGMQWFIDNIMPQINGRLTIVGRGMDRTLFNNLNDRVSIYGFVDDLSDFYRRAKCVVSPIFHGGGMKTKTAEALMYGKYIVATREAFEGYHINPISMKECNCANEFLAAIKEIEQQTKTFYVESRDVFVKYCSYSSSVGILKSLIYG